MGFRNHALLRRKRDRALLICKMKKKILPLCLFFIGLACPFFFEGEAVFTRISGLSEDFPSRQMAASEIKSKSLPNLSFSNESISRTVASVREHVENTAFSVMKRESLKNTLFSASHEDYHWEGGGVLPPDRVLNAFEEVFAILEREPTSGFRQLLFETVAVESHFGRATRYKGAYGLTQILASTGSAARKMAIKNKDPRYYQALKKTYNYNISAVDNLRYNVRYNVAVFVVYCEIYGKANEKLPSLATRNGRWAFYGKYWGAVSKGGATTRDRYFTRSGEISDWLRGNGKNSWDAPLLASN